MTRSGKNVAVNAAASIAALIVAANICAAQTKTGASKTQTPTQAPTKAAPVPTKMPPTKVAPTKIAPTKTAKQSSSLKTSTAPAKPVGAVPDTSGPPPTILREEFEFPTDNRRDPFNSLLTTNELRPTLSDLKVTGILFDPGGRRSYATLRDLTNNTLYRVTTGSTLGRMRVSAIRTRIIVFTIDEFGTTRQDSLVFGDTTKARGK